MRSYWGYRIDKYKTDFFYQELKNERLRQGWGWDPGQDLRSMNLDRHAKRNLPIFKKVKKGDILLIPRLPHSGSVIIAEATIDFDQGYRFEIHEELGDYGHIFPARALKSFSRKNQVVSGRIRSTLRTPMRFWNISYLGDDIENIINSTGNNLQEIQTSDDRTESTIESAFAECFDQHNFERIIFDKFNHQFQAAEWEEALVYALSIIYPNYIVENVGGREEAKHGTDILIRIPVDIMDFEYKIAIQVKDYEGRVSGNAIDQINKADGYWNDEHSKLIDKWIIYTKASKTDNPYLSEKAKDIKIFFLDDLRALMSKMSLSYLGIKPS